MRLLRGCWIPIARSRQRTVTYNQTLHYQKTPIAGGRLFCGNNRQML